MKRRLYLSFEVAKRELFARLITAIELSDEFEVLIGDKSSFHNYIQFLKPGDFFLKSIGPKNVKRVKKLKKNHHRVFGIDEEGLQFYDDDFYMRRQNRIIFDELENYFSWGEHDKQIIEKKFEVKNNKIIPAGNPRIDILKNPYISFFKKYSDIINKKYKKYILFSSKFGKINYIKRTDIKDYIDTQFKSGLLNKNSPNYEKLLNLSKKAKEHEQKNFEAFKEFLKFFSENFKSINLVIAVHPSENRETYENLEKKYENVFVASETIPTVSLILNSICNISCNCTTSIEGFIIGIPQINFLFYRDKDVEYVLPKDISENVNNLEEIEKVIKKIINNEKIDVKNKLLSKHIKNSQANNFSHYIKNSLLKLSKLRDAEDKFNSKTFFNYFKLIEKIREIILPIILDTNKKNLIKRKKIKLFNYNSEFVSKLFDDICKIKNIKNLYIKEYYPGIYIISDKK
jgi:surface carbohydrate biosynthesis protein